MHTFSYFSLGNSSQQEYKDIQLLSELGLQHPPNLEPQQCKHEEIIKNFQGKENSHHIDLYPTHMIVSIRHYLEEIKFGVTSVHYLPTKNQPYQILSHSPQVKKRLGSE